MKVKELIAILQALDQEKEIFLSDHDERHICLEEELCPTLNEVVKYNYHWEGRPENWQDGPISSYYGLFDERAKMLLAMHQRGEVVFPLSQDQQQPYEVIKAYVLGSL